MTDAYNDGNLHGEPVNDVGQDEMDNTQESSGDWEGQAKYFQGEKDKLAAENSTLKKYEKLGHLLESRPDIANAVAGMVTGGGQPAGPKKVVLDKGDFDPWEAYNDPESKSYQFRQQELAETINGAVNDKMQGLARNQGEMQLQTELQQRGLNPNEIDSFMQFASNNPAEYGVDGAIKMWRSVASSEPSAQPQNSLDDVRQTQGNPAVGGVLQGQQPQAPKSDDKTRWEGVLQASRVGNKIP